MLAAATWVNTSQSHRYYNRGLLVAMVIYAILRTIRVCRSGRNRVIYGQFRHPQVILEYNYQQLVTNHLKITREAGGSNVTRPFSPYGGFGLGTRLDIK